MKYKDISVVILLYKTPHKLIKNLKNYKKFNILILDQSNDRELKEKIIKTIPNIKYYGLTNKNNGFAKSINFLVRKSQSKYILCTQPDTYISAQSIIKLKNTFKNKKDAIITVPKIINYKNFYDKKRRKVFPVKNILGAIFLADRKKFIKFKMFDERFFFYWEDIDLCKRISYSKFKIYINTLAQAKHKGLRSVKLNLKTFVLRKVYFKYGEYLFQSKYKNLKLIKVIREPLKFIFFSFYHFFAFNFKKSLENLCFVYAILRFIVKKTL